MRSLENTELSKNVQSESTRRKGLPSHLVCPFSTTSGHNSQVIHLRQTKKKKHMKLVLNWSLVLPTLVVSGLVTDRRQHWTEKVPLNGSGPESVC